MNEFETWWGEFSRNYWTHIGYDIEADEHVYRVAQDSWNAAIAAERERCAKIAEQHTVEMPVNVYDMYNNGACKEIAQAIREQGGEDEQV